MLRDVDIKVTDGGLSAGGTKGEGIHLKIGASPAYEDGIISIRGSYDARRIKEILGLCPLADACMDSIENGSSLIYCLPIKPSTEGVSSQVVKTGTGTGKVAITGVPNNSFDLIVTITETGGLNLATFTYSVNGGLTNSAETTIPINGKFSIPDTGLEMTFTEGVSADQSFVIGDKHAMSSTAPLLTSGDIVGAVEKLKSVSQSFEFVHIVGETSIAVWAAVSVAQEELNNKYKIPMMFVLEAFSMGKDETVEVYVEKLLAARKSVDNYDLQVVTARANYLRMDGSAKNINMAGIVCGLYARSMVQESIGKTKAFPLLGAKVLGLVPTGIEERLQFLDEAGYLTVREYVGLDGYYVTNARMMCPEGSDYKYAEHTRVKNKIIRKLRTEALGNMHNEIDMADVEGSLQVLGKFLEAPLDMMIADKEITSARVIIPDGQDILTTEKVSFKVRFVPRGYAREFEIDFGMETI